MEAVIRFLQDPHPRVRYAACNAIGQMATDFAPVFQKRFHEMVVPGLLLVMDDGVNPRVQVRLSLLSLFLLLGVVLIAFDLIVPPPFLFLCVLSPLLCF